MEDETLIAPCGMNCSICTRYLALRNSTKSEGVEIPYCVGCRKGKNKCAFQKKCDFLKKDQINFCFQCNDFPCDRLQRLDKRYRTNYRMSMISNLKFIKKNGILKFLKREEEKWDCKRCNQARCCHNGLCYKCDIARLKNKRKNKLYRWEDIK